MNRHPKASQEVSKIFLKKNFASSELELSHSKGVMELDPYQLLNRIQLEKLYARCLLIKGVFFLYYF